MILAAVNLTAVIVAAIGAVPLTIGAVASLRSATHAKRTAVSVGAMNGSGSLQDQLVRLSGAVAGVRDEQGLVRRDLATHEAADEKVAADMRDHLATVAAATRTLLAQ